MCWFPANASGVTGVLNVQQFHDQVVKVTTCHNCSFEEQLALEQVRAELLSPLGYSVYIGQRRARDIGHSSDALITDCKLIIMKGRSLKKVPCFPETGIRYRFDANFYNCYILRLPKPRAPDFYVIGISLVLHLDNFFKDHVMYFDKTNTLARTAGLELSLHRPGTMPVVGFDGEFLSPGYFTNIKLKFARRTRLGHPYGNCTTIDTWGNQIYTFDYCYSACFERIIRETCRCEDFSPYTVTTGAENNTMLPSCMDIRQGQKELLEKWGCFLQERNNAAITCVSRCTTPCEEVQYQTQVKIVYDNVIKWRLVPRYWPFVRGIHRWIPLTKASDAKLWCSLWSAPE